MGASGDFRSGRWVPAPEVEMSVSHIKNNNEPLTNNNNNEEHDSMHTDNDVAVAIMFVPIPKFDNKYMSYLVMWLSSKSA